MLLVSSGWKSWIFANHPKMHRTAPTTKEYLVQNVNRPELSNPALRHSKTFKKKIKFCQQQKCKEQVEMTSEGVWAVSSIYWELQIQERENGLRRGKKKSKVPQAGVDTRWGRSQAKPVGPLHQYYWTVDCACSHGSWQGTASSTDSSICKAPIILKHF
jgi:hypothetical protein